MSWALNNLTAPDSYTPAATLENLPRVGRVNLDVYNSGIYWQLKQPSGTGLATEGTWGAEVFMGPGSRTIFRHAILGVRIRAAIPAAQLTGPQAQTTVEAVE